AELGALRVAGLAGRSSDERHLMLAAEQQPELTVGDLEHVLGDDRILDPAQVAGEHRILVPARRQKIKLVARAGLFVGQGGARVELDADSVHGAIAPDEATGIFVVWVGHYRFTLPGKVRTSEVDHKW